MPLHAAEIRKLAPYIHTEVCADAGAFLREMLRRRGSIRMRDLTCWKKRCAEWKDRYPVVLPEHRKPEGLVSIYHFAETLDRISAPEDLLVSGSSGTAIEIFLFASPARAGRRIFHTAGLGSMGNGLPAAIGVCLAGGRVVTTASDAHAQGRLDLDDLQSERSYSAMRVYGTTKLCNILFTRELARRAPELHANCFHPGVVRTGFGKNENGIWKLLTTIGGPFMRSPERGARCQNPGRASRRVRAGRAVARVPWPP